MRRGGARPRTPRLAYAAAVPADEIALFRRFPALRGALPRHPFLDVPTPITRIAVEECPDGALWVKHDERSCASYGGNKPRKLELVIGHALAEECRRLVTTGGLGTNHGLATTILGREAGLDTTLVLLHQPITNGVRQTLRLHAAYGARHVYGANVAGTALQVLRVLAGAGLRGERPYLVATGGSSVRGDLGFVSAGLELAEQIAAGELPAPERIFVPVGTGGTFAGLITGLRLAGLRTRVTGVLVTDILPPSPARLARASRRMLALLRRSRAEVPALVLEPADFDFAREQLGAGYGAATPAAEEAVARAAERGLVLETTYTGKCLAAILARARAGTLGPGPILFWNTYNGIDVAARAPRTLTDAELPHAIRRVLARAPSPAAFDAASAG